MRILSYNILDGGEDRGDLLTRVIQFQKPEVVGLVEADSRDVVSTIARRLNMDFIHAPGNSHASALLSRFPIRHTINHAPLHTGLSKSLLEAVVVDPTGNEWTFGVVHFHHAAYEEDEVKREGELAVLLEIFKPHRDLHRPHVLMGDFNSNAPYQQIDPAKCKPKTRDAWEKNGGHIPRRIVQKLLDAGYRDSLREARPPAAQTLTTFTTKHPGQRVDYIFPFGFDRARLIDAWVIHDQPSEKASDHYPVGAEIL